MSRNYHNPEYDNYHNFLIAIGFNPIPWPTTMHNSTERSNAVADNPLWELHHQGRQSGNFDMVLQKVRQSAREDF
jgi:hypothetical protein